MTSITAFQCLILICSDVFRALSPSKPFGVVPQENTIFGNVIETYDALRTTLSGYIRGEETLKVTHCLLVRKGVSLSDIEVVMSHEQVCSLRLHMSLCDKLIDIERRLDSVKAIYLPICHLLVQ